MGFAKGKRDWRRTALAMALALACFFATWAVFGLRYELNDDAQLANIAMGAYGEDTHHLVYVNVLLGWFLKPFYALAANVNWYYFLQVAANVAAFGMLGTLCMERLGTRRGLLLYGGVLLVFGVDMFNSFQYTKNSALYLTVGLALLASELGVWSLRTGAGLFWAVLGSMVRFQNFFAVGGLAAALLLWRFLCLEKRARLRALAAAVALFALVGAAKAVDLAAYSTGGWRSFTEYNAARTEFSDFKIYSYTDKTQIEALGYTANDFDMLKSWSFYAPEVFTPQALDALSENAPQAGFVQTAKSTVYTLAGLLAGRPYRLAFGGVLLAWLFFAGKKGRLAFLGTMAVFGAEVFYLLYQGRFVRHVEFSMILAAVVFGVMCISPRAGAVPGRRALGFAAAAVCVVCLPYFMQLRTDMQQYRIDRVDRPEYYEMSADKEHLYLMDVETLDSLAGNNVFHPRPAGFFSNIVELGGWLSGAPHRVEALAAYEVEDPYRGITGDNVYLVDSVYVSTKQAFLREHYGMEVEMEKLKDYTACSLYKVHEVQQ